MFDDLPGDSGPPQRLWHDSGGMFFRRWDRWKHGSRQAWSITMSSQSAKIVATYEAPDVAEARLRRGPAKALDLVYLARQSLGDKKLETELLVLFDRQSAQVVERLSQIRPDADPSWPRDLAHTLIGSARAVGAFGVAAAAEAYEALTVAGAPAPEIETAFEILSEEVEMTRVSISRLLG